MAISKVQTKMACVTILTLMVVAYAPHGTQALSCGQVLMMVSPCLSYLKKGGQIPATCCSGVKNLANAAKTVSDRQQACSCLKPAVKSQGINYDLANKLPGACGIDYQINIHPNMDCSTVKF